MSRYFSLLLCSCLFLASCSSGSSSSENGTNAGDSDGTTSSGDITGGTTDGTTGSTAGEDSSGGTDGSGSSGGVSEVGVVSVSRTVSSFDSITLNARFNRFSPVLSEFSLPAQFVPEEDTCVISTDGSVPTVTTTDIGFDLIFFFVAGETRRAEVRERYQNSGVASISAGETLVFTSPTGTFGQLDLDSNGGYQMPNGSIIGTAPDSLVLDLIGGEFPMFAAVDIPVVPHLVFSDTTPNSSTAVFSDSSLTWEPATGTDTFVAIRGQARDLNVIPVVVVDVVCVLPDDGAFELTKVLQQQVREILALGADEPAAFTAFELQRVSYRTLRDGDTLLILQSVVAGEQVFQ